ncbi:DUF2059 domain-containing protein [Roseibium aggregatum]|uniref:DUF2059 domain-containing protein n=1 Tax=Roseibium aggregatum TaxID=187304 RepID=A0A926NUE6_9HYPH|nr:DUF2059 domain-containing protein [Roseibium aggregatum]MBD1546634.1 DUF2059 domain-containing protein [Roseibium aggregatum]
MVLKNCLKAGTRIAAAALVAVTLLPVMVNAQDKEVSEAQLEAARKVVVANKALDAFDEILPLMAEQTRTIFIQADPFKSDEVSAITNEVALKLAAKRKDLNEMIYKIWANRFSVEELEQLAEFYNSPIGQKLATETPSITALSIGAARQWQDQISTEMVSLVREEMQKRDQENADAPAAPAAPAGKPAQ